MYHIKFVPHKLNVSHRRLIYNCCVIFTCLRPMYTSNLTHLAPAVCR